MTDETIEEEVAETSDPEPGTESIFVLMGRILRDLPPIPKASQAPANMGGYAFRGIEDITAALKPIVGPYGVFCLPVTDDRETSERPVGNNRTMYCVDVHVRFRFYGPLGDYVEATAWGQGTDMGDKATQKAYTSAFKSMLTVTFLIADEQTDAELHDVPETQGGRRQSRQRQQRQTTRQRKTEDSEPDVPADEGAVDSLRDRISALPEEQQRQVRERWMGLRSLAPYRLDTLPQRLVDLVDDLVKGAEAAARAESGEEAPPPESGPQNGSQPPQEATEDRPGIDPAFVKQIEEEVKGLDQEEVDARLKTWSLPVSGAKAARRQRLVEAMVRDRVRQPA